MTGTSDFLPYKLIKATATNARPLMHAAQIVELDPLLSPFRDRLFVFSFFLRLFLDILSEPRTSVTDNRARTSMRTRQSGGLTTHAHPHLAGSPNLTSGPHRNCVVKWHSCLTMSI